MVVYQWRVEAYDLWRVIPEYGAVITHSLLRRWYDAGVSSSYRARVIDIENCGIATASLVHYHVSYIICRQVIGLGKSGLFQAGVRIVIDALIAKVHRHIFS